MDDMWNTLIRELRNGSQIALSKLITQIENRDPGWMDAMKQIYPFTGNAKLIGITGPPGAGKSTLTDKIARDLAGRGFQVGIIAVDPSSPFSGGAILADRIRMSNVCELDAVFSRSMSTRGRLGGLNQSARDVAKLMDAFGKDVIIIETVGAGQDEVDVVNITDVVLVVCVPGQGDAIQAIKAGIMEIADIFVVNKSDRDGADQVVLDIESMLALQSDPNGPKPLIIKTNALSGTGVRDLVDNAMELADSCKNRPGWKEEQIKLEIVDLVEKEVVKRIISSWEEGGSLDNAVGQIIKQEKDPYSLVIEIVTELMRP